MEQRVAFHAIKDKAKRELMDQLCYEQGIEPHQLGEIPLEDLKASLARMGKEVDDGELEGAVALFAK